MPRVLEIHHIDVNQGDSTLILVRNQTNNAIQRSVLIDAGLYNQGQTVHTYLTNQGVAQLNVLIASHYDRDHYWGLRWLLEQTTIHTYDNTNIYDRGEWGQVDQFGNVSGRKDDFQRYINAAQRLGTRTRHTAMVNANVGGHVPHGWETPDWLLNQGDLLGLPAGAPTMTCKVANQYVSGANNNTFVFGGLAIDDNPLSLGFMIEFNNFRYYTAGDLEIPQEEFAAARINPNGADHVCAMKASHHGSIYSTSRAFVNRMRPRVSFISCGNNNGYHHPFPQVIGNLSSYANMLNIFLTACGDDLPRADIPGCQNPPQNQVALDPIPLVAGDDANPGHIVLRVTENQSQANPHQFSVRYWEHNQVGGAGNRTITYTC